MRELKCLSLSGLRTEPSSVAAIAPMISCGRERHGVPCDDVPVPGFPGPRRRRATTTDQIIARLDALAASGADFQAILETAVQGVHQLDPRFHWTGIYELFPDDVLRLGPFIGAPTEHAFIGVGRGVCGTAVAERRNMNIPDVSRTPNYLACSSDTRSELVVLIRRGETIYAQIDIDSHELAAFDEAAVKAVERVADWLAHLYESRASAQARP